MSGDDKAGLRVKARALRRRLRAEAPDAGARAADAFAAAALGPFRAAALYLPAGSEIDPGPLARLLAEGGVRLALPAAPARDAGLVFRAWASDAPLTPDALGLPAPPPEAPALRPDLVVAPLLAFDAAGARLGQGGGFYDRAIAELRRDGGVFVLGLAFAAQEVARLPLEAHDQRLDAVLTELGLRRFDRQGGCDR